MCIIGVLICVTIWWLSFYGTYEFNHILQESPLRDVIKSDSEKVIIKENLLTLVPIGTSIEKAESILAKHFKGDLHRLPDLPDIDEKIFEFDYLCVRIFSSGRIFVGGDWTEAVFIFGTDNNLKEIIVEEYGVWL